MKIGLPFGIICALGTVGFAGVLIQTIPANALMTNKSYCPRGVPKRQGLLDRACGQWAPDQEAMSEPSYIELSADHDERLPASQNTDWEQGGSSCFHLSGEPVELALETVSMLRQKEEHEYKPAGESKSRASYSKPNRQHHNIDLLPDCDDRNLV